jgi:hypothetical protein
MTRAHFGYSVDLFYRDPGGIDGFRKETHRIVAYGDLDAIREASNAGVLVPKRPLPEFFRVRKVFRKHEEMIFDSRKSEAS